LRESGSPKSSAPLSGETTHRTPKSFKSARTCSRSSITVPCGGSNRVAELKTGALSVGTSAAAVCLSTGFVDVMPARRPMQRCIRGRDRDAVHSNPNNTSLFSRSTASAFCLRPCQGCRCDDARQSRSDAEKSSVKTKSDRSPSTNDQSTAPGNRLQLPQS